ncbi:MAG: DUF6084 family protein [Verrucomicrobiota bacterium]
MPDLAFQVTGVEPAERGLAPLLTFQLEVANTPAQEAIQSVLLQVQIQLQAPQRRYNAGEKDKLSELFGAPERWGGTLRTRLWTQAVTHVGGFSGRTTAALTIPCSFDLNIAATKYFYALDDGEVPLLFLFSGTVFYEGEGGRLQVQQIAWNKEAAWRMPVRAWREAMDRHYPGTAWLTLDREIFDRLYAYRRANGLPTWDQTIEQLLPALAPTEVPV